MYTPVAVNCTVAPIVATSAVGGVIEIWSKLYDEAQLTRNTASAITTNKQTSGAKLHSWATFLSSTNSGSEWGPHSGN